MTHFIARSNGVFEGLDAPVTCALGRNGVIAAAYGREGDGATPLGTWPLRRVFYRTDRLQCPETGLETVPLQPHDGWCDAPADPLYNRPVTLPYPASHEKLWREDNVYDVIIELGFNDDPPVPGLGSAIFWHLVRGDYEPTEGCVALALDDMLAALRLAGPGSVLEIIDQS